jgi:hypothetical protein
MLDLAENTLQRQTLSLILTQTSCVKHQLLLSVRRHDILHDVTLHNDKYNVRKFSITVKN